MQLLVDIPEEEADIPKEDYYQVALTKIMLMCFGCKVTKLPKGHGRLIDANELKDRMYHEAFETDTDLQKWDSGCWIRYKMFENIEKSMPTIIDGDKEET